MGHSPVYLETCGLVELCDCYREIRNLFLEINFGPERQHIVEHIWTEQDDSVLEETAHRVDKLADEPLVELVPTVDIRCTKR